jgi:hypothetical protein
MANHRHRMSCVDACTATHVDTRRPCMASTEAGLIHGVSRRVTQCRWYHKSLLWVHEDDELFGSELAIRWCKDYLSLIATMC